MRILVIDDSRTVQRALEATLSRHGQVDVAGSASQALACMQAHTYAWIIADLSMGDTAGKPPVDWLGQINDHRHGAQVIIHSVNDSPEVVSACKGFSFHQVDKGDANAILKLIVGPAGRFLSQPEIGQLARREAQQLISDAERRMAAACDARTEKLFREMGLWHEDLNRPNLECVLEWKTRRDKLEKAMEKAVMALLSIIAAGIAGWLWKVFQAGLSIRIVSP